MRALLLLILLSTPVLAERPFRTDDPYQTRLYGWEVFGGVEIGSGSFGGIKNRTNMDFNAGFDYGITEKSEIGLSGDLFRVQDPGQEGIGDAVLHYKHRMTEATPSVPDIALDFHLKLPTGSKANGLGSGKADFGLISLFGWKGDPWTTTLRLGYIYTLSELEKNRWELGVATRYQASETVRFLGELSLDRDRREAALGAARLVAPGTWLDLMLGAGLSEIVPDVSVRFGVTSTL